MHGSRLETWGWWAAHRARCTRFEQLRAEFAERLKGYVTDKLTPEALQRIYDELWSVILSRTLPPNARVEIHESTPDRLNVTITVPVDHMDLHLVI
jgi:membrane protein implicated in regulation of membrane protease activity